MRLLDGLVGPPIEPLTPKHPSQPSLLTTKHPGRPPPPRNCRRWRLGRQATILHLSSLPLTARPAAPPPHTPRARTQYVRSRRSPLHLAAAGA